MRQPNIVFHASSTHGLYFMLILAQPGLAMDLVQSATQENEKHPNHFTQPMLQASFYTRRMPSAEVDRMS